LTSLYIEWATVADPDSAVIGYILEMDDGLGGDFTEIYDGSYSPGITYFLKEDLVTGREYKFIVYAINYNGLSVGSDAGSFFVCSEPSGFAAPYLTDQSTTQMIVNWIEPTDTGGCSITGYAIYRDDGANGDIITEVNSASDASVRDLPSLNEYTVTYFPASSDGFTFRFQIKVFTSARDALSETAYFILATTPDAPSDQPVEDSDTSESQIVVTFASSDPSDGGSSIISYEL
jgi:hypothetical protein